MSIETSIETPRSESATPRRRDTIIELAKANLAKYHPGEEVRDDELAQVIDAYIASYSKPGSGYDTVTEEEIARTAVGAYLSEEEPEETPES